MNLFVVFYTCLFISTFRKEVRFNQPGSPTKNALLLKNAHCTISHNNETVTVSDCTDNYHQVRIDEDEF